MCETNICKYYGHNKAYAKAVDEWLADSLFGTSSTPMIPDVGSADSHIQFEKIPTPTSKSLLDSYQTIDTVHSSNYIFNSCTSAVCDLFIELYLKY